MRREDSPQIIRKPVRTGISQLFFYSEDAAVRHRRASNAWGQEFPARGNRAIDIQLNGEALIGFSRASAIRMATPVTRPTIVTSPG